LHIFAAGFFDVMSVGGK